MCCCFRSSNKSALVVTRILIASSFLNHWRSGGSPRLAGHGTRALILVCAQARLGTLRGCLWLVFHRWNEPLPTDRKAAAGLSPVIELKNEFIGDIERHRQRNHWSAGAIGRRGRIVLDHSPNPPFLVLCSESPLLARVAITNAGPQAIDRLLREAWQNPRAIHANSEMGSGSTYEIRRSASESSHVDGALPPPTDSDHLDLFRTTLPESRSHTARWCPNPSLLLWLVL